MSSQVIPLNPLPIPIGEVFNPATIGEPKKEKVLKAQRPKLLVTSPLLPGEHCKEVLGGKGYSLASLNRIGSLNVPNFWIIPCEACFTRPVLNFSRIRTYVASCPKALFAVRSSGPVSMPGMMTTKLNVALGDLNKAVAEVWDSFFTEHATAYRDNNNISHKTGTAVVIQQMVEPIAAGVAFTNDPNAWLDQKEFSPIIEYVNGLGEALVGGTVTPTVADGSESWYKMLAKKLKAIHDILGPSDVEWCVDKYGDSYFVQQRALKFVEPVLDNTDFEGKKLVVFGKPIGAGVVLTAPVAYAHAFDSATGDAVYLEDFRPEYYKKMVTASAIITGKGGNTCHAAIIARDMKKPAITGITSDRLGYGYFNKRPVLLIDGIKGRLFEGDATDVMVPLDAPPTVTLDATRTPFFELGCFSSENKAHNAHHLLVRFYKVMDDYANGVIDETRKDMVVKEIASLFVTYFYKAAAGECRYAHRKCGSSQSLRNTIKKLRALVPMIPFENDSTPERSTFWGQLNQPKSIHQAIEVIETCHALFTDYTWASGYGGKKWGTVTQLLLYYLRGEFTATLFVDGAFNLKHNGGAAFDKCDWLLCNKESIGQQLNTKAKNSIKSLVELTNTLAIGSSWWGSLQEHLAVESIFTSQKRKELETHVKAMVANSATDKAEPAKAPKSGGKKSGTKKPIITAETASVGGGSTDANGSDSIGDSSAVAHTGENNERTSKNI